MAKIMVIAGGEWQCPIVQTAKSMGHTVICSNLYEDSPAFTYADVGEVADVLDREKNLWIAKKYKPDAVLTDQSDIAVPTVAYVAEQMHLKGIGEEKAELFTNKYKMREFCEKHGFPSPVCYHCTDYREAEEALKKLGRAIIKPLDSQSSRGIYIIDSPEQLKEVFEKSMSYSNNEKAVLVEQYIEGTEFTVDGVKTASGYQVTAISRKNHFSYNPNVANELLFSWKDADYDYKELEELNIEMVTEMGLPFGMSHAEYKYMDGKNYLIEIAARGGGTKISSDIVPFMSGVNSNAKYINMLLGKQEHCNIQHDMSKYSVLGFLDFREGHVTRISGMDRARQVPGVLEVALHFKEGDQIYAAQDDRSRVGHYLLVADSYEQLRSREKQMKDSIVIEYGR